MKEEDRIKLWLALYEEGDIRGGECYIDYIYLTKMLKRFGVSYKEIEREILTLLAWGLIEKASIGSYRDTYRRKKSWRPSLGMLLLDRMDDSPFISGRMPK